MHVNTLDASRQEDKETRVQQRLISGVEQIDAGIGCHGPVVVFARTVDTREGLLVQ